MFAIISLVPKEHIPILNSISELLQENDAYAFSNKILYPHFSWQVAEGYQKEKLNKVLNDLASESTPFEIWITGIGIFTGIMPVLYLPIIKTSELVDFHTRIWIRTKEIVTKPIEYYDIEQWIPHITIYQQLGQNREFDVSLKKLINLPIKLKMKIDNIALGQIDEESARIIEVFKFNVP